MYQFIESHNHSMKSVTSAAPRLQRRKLRHGKASGFLHTAESTQQHWGSSQPGSVTPKSILGSLPSLPLGSGGASMDQAGFKRLEESEPESQAQGTNSWLSDKVWGKTKASGTFKRKRGTSVFCEWTNPLLEREHSVNE